MDRRWYVFLRCLCLTQVWIGSFMAFRDHPNMSPLAWNYQAADDPLFRIVMLLKSTKWWNNNLLASPGSFWIFRGDSCDDERNAERNSWKLKIIHDLSRKIINQTSILGILVNQTKGIAIGELINPNLNCAIFLKVWFEFRRDEIFITCIFFWFDQQTLDYHSKITSVQGFITRLFF